MLIRANFSTLVTSIVMLLLGGFPTLASGSSVQDTGALALEQHGEQPLTPKRLIVSNSKAWKPYSFLDDANQPAGILIDLWKAYGEANDVVIEFKLVDWQESIDLVKAGQADVHAGLLWSRDRAKALAFGEPLFELDTQLYFHHSLQSFDADEFLLGHHNHMVGVVRGGYEAEYMLNHFPEVGLAYFANNALMIKAARDDRIRAFVADLQVANYYLHIGPKSGQFIDVKHLYSGDIHYATSQSNVSLMESIIADFKHVGKQDLQRIYGRWMHIETVYPSYLPAIAISGIIIMLLIYLVILKHVVRTKTQELSAENVQLKYLSETDALTGLWNRRYFLDKLKYFRRSNSNLTVMIIDIDNFKIVNDTYGHIKGDVVIKHVSEKIKALTNSSHIVARIGGEEFALAFIDQPVCFSDELAHRICESVRDIDLDEIDGLPVTVSLGCAIYHCASDFETLYEADKLMYAAKKQGKNQAVVEYIPTQVEPAQALE